MSVAARAKPPNWAYIIAPTNRHPFGFDWEEWGRFNALATLDAARELGRAFLECIWALAFPVIGYQLWRFVAPGLYRSEKNAFLPFLIASPALFLIGAAFAHYIVVPLAMAFFLGFADLPSLVAAYVTDTGELAAPGAAARDSGIDIVFNGKVNETLDITLKLIVAFGLCFQLPVLLTLMGKAGLASSRGLRATRKYAVVGILTVAAIVTLVCVTG